MKTVENGGENGYDRDLFGDEITIERYLSSRTGCYGFKLLDIDGMEKSRSTSDVFSLLGHLNIGINNPAAILRQSRARKVAQPKDMYRFFTNATKMDTVTETYNKVVEEVGKCRMVKNRVASAVKEKEGKVAKLKKEWERDRETLISDMFRSSGSSNRSVVNVNESYMEAEKVSLSRLPCNTHSAWLLNNGMKMLDLVRHNHEMLDGFQALHSNLSQKYLMAKADLEEQQDVLKIIDKELERMEQQLRLRKKRLKKEQAYLLTLASVCFDECMQTVDASGRLQFDYERSELSLVVSGKRRQVNCADETNSYK